MTEESARAAVASALRRINAAWPAGRAEDLERLVDAGIVMVSPGFGERHRGARTFVAGHREFHDSATIREFREHDYEIDVVGDTAVATYRYELTYERDGRKYLSTGRDLYVFVLRDGQWLAVWRTILDPEETAV